MTHLSPIENLFAVEVPLNAKDFGCVHVFNGEDILYYPDEKGETVPIASAPCHCDLVEILFTTKDCSEEQAADVVQYDEMVNKNYYRDYDHPAYDGENYVVSDITAIESLQSLLRANALDESKNYLLIKKL